MKTCIHNHAFSNYRNKRQDNRQRMLKRLELMRKAKAAKRERMIAQGWEPEPKMYCYYPLELGVRDKRTGQTAWIDLKSTRDAAKRLTVILKYYKP